MHGRDRTEAIARMRAALGEMKIGPIATTIPLHQNLINQPAFINADFDINWVERYLEE